MKFSPAQCPTCGEDWEDIKEHVWAEIEPQEGDNGTPSRSYDYTGTTNLDEQEPIQTPDGYSIARCTQRHEQPVQIEED